MRSHFYLDTIRALGEFTSHPALKSPLEDLELIWMYFLTIRYNTFIQRDTSDPDIKLHSSKYYNKLGGTTMRDDLLSRDLGKRLNKNITFTPLRLF